MYKNFPKKKSYQGKILYFLEENLPYLKFKVFEYFKM